MDQTTDNLMDTGEASREACRRLKEALAKLDEDIKARAALEAQVKRVADAIDKRSEKEEQGFNIAIFIRNLFSYGVTEIERYYPKGKSKV